MDAIEKVRVRLEHWIAHNDQHEDEYEKFARQLEEAGKHESAGHVREMMSMSSKGNECLRRALSALDK